MGLTLKNIVGLIIILGALAFINSSFYNDNPEGKMLVFLIIMNIAVLVFMFPGKGVKMKSIFSLSNLRNKNCWMRIPGATILAGYIFYQLFLHSTPLQTAINICLGIILIGQILMVPLFIGRELTLKK